MDDGLPYGRSCSAFATDGPEAEARLSPPEVGYCRQLPERRRTEFRAGRLAAERAVCELRPSSRGKVCLTVRSRPGRPPTVWATDHCGVQQLRLSLSITHRDGRAAAVACDRDTRVGIDLERRGAVPPGHLAYFMRQEEVDRARLRAPALDATMLWTLKEASWKALALPRSTPFTALELFFEDGELTELRHGGRRWRACARFRDPWPGYRVSTVWARPWGRS